ncbi:MAG: hypothetical protein IPJ69_07540 [Deltaproteobacteria bacterium]|nr:MAG: hypothetical protein IPJ69_07540 [Deltaproteobacteria bacterium]
MKKIIFICLIALTLNACGGSSLLNNQDSGATGTLSVNVLHHLADGSTLEPVGGSKTFTNNQGFQITLSEAQIGWRSLQLISGGTDSSFPECVAGRDIRVNLGGADDVLGEDATSLSLVTNQNIQQVSYCRYQIVLGPTATPAGLVLENSKSHTTGATASGAATPTTVTYHFQGTWRKGTDSGDINFVRSEPITLLPQPFRVLEAGHEVSHPLHFHAGSTHEDLSFEIHYDDLFSDINFSAQAATAQNIFDSNFSESIHQSIVSD